MQENTPEIQKRETRRWIDIVCARCGGNDVRRDADAAWIVDDQCWELAGLYDKGVSCGECGSDNVSLKEVEITPEERTAFVADTEKGAPPFNERELATVLAALRYWQREGWISSGGEHFIANDGGELTPLDAVEIDALCERINC